MRMKIYSRETCRKGGGRRRRRREGGGKRCGVGRGKRCETVVELVSIPRSFFRIFKINVVN